MISRFNQFLLESKTPFPKFNDVLEKNENLNEISNLIDELNDTFDQKIEITNGWCIVSGNIKNPIEICFTERNFENKTPDDFLEYEFRYRWGGVSSEAEWYEHELKLVECKLISFSEYDESEDSEDEDMGFGRYSTPITNNKLDVASSIIDKKIVELKRNENDLKSLKILFDLMKRILKIYPEISIVNNVNSYDFAIVSIPEMKKFTPPRRRGNKIRE